MFTITVFVKSSSYFYFIFNFFKLVFSIHVKILGQVCWLTEQDALCFALSQDGLKYSQQRFGQLLLQVVLCVNGNVVLQHVDGVLNGNVVWGSLSKLNVSTKKETDETSTRPTHLWLHVCRCSLRSLDDDIWDSVSQVGGATCISFPHPVNQI